MLTSSLPFLFGLGFSLALTPMARRIALQIGAIDNPGDRRIHSVPMPRFGGSAILSALILAMLFASLLDRRVDVMLWSERHRLGLLTMGALMVTVVGGIDDVRPLRPGTKLLVEIVAASVATYSGYRIDLPSIYHLSLLSYPLSVLFIVTATNAVNLVDGLDGLAVGLCLIAAATLILLGWSGGQVNAPVLLAALCGVLVGFLYYNFQPAQIFLGDSGALLLGFLLGAHVISASQRMAGHVAMLAPFLALGLPLGELVLTIIRRLLRPLRVARSEHGLGNYQFVSGGRPTLLSADRDHIHHRLLGLGLNHRTAVLLLYGASATVCAAALLMANGDGVYALSLLAAVGVGFVVAVRSLGYRELMPLRSGLLLPLFGSRLVGLKLFQVTADVIAVISSYALAGVFEGQVNSASRDFLLASLPLIVVCQMAAFASSGLYRRSWRHAGIDDAIAVGRAIAMALMALGIAALLVPSIRASVGVVILDGYFLATMMLGTRLSFRVLDHLFQPERAEARRVLIYGAGRAGAVALNEIRTRPALGMTVVGFLDDDERKCGVKLQGVAIHHLARVTELLRAGSFDLVVLSSAKIKLARAQMLAEQCRRAGLDFVRFGIEWQAAPPERGLEASASRRSAAVVPIRSAGVPQ